MDKADSDKLPDTAVPLGWQIEFCQSCGFLIITMAGGKHYCPRCN